MEPSIFGPEGIIMIKLSMIELTHQLYVYVQCYSDSNHSLIQVAHPMEDIGQTHKADISSFIGGIVYGPV